MEKFNDTPLHEALNFRLVHACERLYMCSIWFPDTSYQSSSWYLQDQLSVILLISPRPVISHPRDISKTSYQSSSCYLQSQLSVILMISPRRVISHPPDISKASYQSSSWYPPAHLSVVGRKPYGPGPYLRRILWETLESDRTSFSHAVDHLLNDQTHIININTSETILYFIAVWKRLLLLITVSFYTGRKMGRC